MLNNSRLFSFLDENYNFTIHFFEGQKLIHDLVLKNSLKHESFAFYRDIVLSFLPLISFLKPSEAFGIYIDSVEPFFTFKLETNEAGYTRCLLLPNDFSEFPQQLNGQCRINKIQPNIKTPYTSIIDLNNSTLHQLVNRVLNESYQIQSQLILSDKSDQSILITKLPTLGGTQTNIKENLNINEYITKNQQDFNRIFELALNGDESIINTLSKKNGFTYLSGKDIQFQCNCSKERFIMRIQSIQNMSQDDLFGSDEVIETKCDYCNKTYLINKEELKTFIQ